MNTPRITRQDAANHFGKHVAGQHPPRAKVILDDIWGGKQQSAEPVEEVVFRMAERVGFTELSRTLGPGIFEFTVPEDGYYSFLHQAPPFEGPQNRQGRRAHARKMRKLGLGLVEIRKVGEWRDED